MAMSSVECEFEKCIVHVQIRNIKYFKKNIVKKIKNGSTLDSQFYIE